MESRRLFFTILAMSLMPVVRSQSDLSKVVPPSPTTREFEKYINYEVSLHSGVPDITVPLYIIKAGTLSIPISLSYHASGIKYKQTNGDLGAGWTLQPGNRVSRTMYGRKDEEFPMPTTIQAPESITNAADRDAYLARFGKSETDGSLPNLSGSWLDGEYDIFTYSLIGSTGNFIIKDRQNKQTAMLTATVDKVVNYGISNDLYSSPGFEFFDLIDGNGVKYRMGKSISGNLDGIESTSWYRTAWMVRDIVTPFNETVKFNYELRLEESFPANHTVTLREGEGPFIHEPVLQAGYYTGSFSQNVYRVPFLTEIITEYETITFIRPAQSSQPGPYDNCITAMEVRNKQGELIKRVDFIYTHNKYGAYDPYDYVLLKNIAISGKTNSGAAEVYQFDYKGAISTNLVHSHDYWGYIFWHTPTAELGLPTSLGTEGIMDMINDASFSTTFNQIQLKLGGEFEIPKYQTKTIVNDPTDYTLYKITYPTGGYVVYDYESNKYYNQSGNVEKGAGLRVKTISHYDPVVDVNLPVLQREYLYGENNNGVGVAKLRPDPRRFAIENLTFMQAPSMDNIYILNRSIDLSEMPATEDFNDAIGSGGVHYTEVNVIQSNKGLNNGREKYIYESAWGNSYYFFIKNSGTMKIGQDRGGGDRTFNRLIVPGFIKIYTPYYKSPNLKRKEVYDKDNNIIEKEEYVYDNSPVETFEGLKVRRFVTNQLGTTHDLYAIWGLRSYFDYDKYTIYSGKNLLTEKVTTSFINNIPALSVSQKLTYNSYGQLKSETISGSKSDSRVIENSYSLDFTGLTATDNFTAGLKKLNDLNVVNPYLEKRVYRKNEADNKFLVSSQFNVFHPESPVLYKSLITEQNSALTDFAPLAVGNGALIYDNRYKTIIEFDAYDNKGNLLQQHKTDDVNHSYIWGYNKAYPIAEAINAQAKDIFHTSFEEGDGNSDPGDSKTGGKCKIDGFSKSLANLTNNNYTLSWWQKSGSSWTLQQRSFTVTDGAYTIDLTGQVDEVRFYPSDALMTTYTYAPLIGMTSRTDPNNRTTYYEYDGLNRLAIIRDQDRNVVKKVCYNYAGQIEDCSTNITPICTTRNCTEEGYKCVNNVCEQGIRICTESVPAGGGMYRTYFHYEFSDGSWEDGGSMVGPFRCANDNP